jgi:type III secretion system YscD/HrpQ family protein
MQSDRMLELRVLTGTHAGARVLLPDQPQSLGSASDCDLILTDEGLLAHHAQIEAQGDGTVLLRWLAPPGQEVMLQAGEGAELGPVRIAIDSADMPWRESVTLRGPVATPAVLDATAEEPGKPRDGQRSEPPKHPPRFTSALANGLGWAFAGLGLLTFGIALVQRIPFGAGPASPPSMAKDAGAASGQTAPSALAAVEAAIAPLGLGSRVRIEADARAGAHGLRVRAAYLDAAQAQALREALQRVSPVPRLDILTPDQVQALLEDALLMQDGGTTSRLTALALEGGRFRIEGRAGSRLQGDELLARLQRAVPWVQGLDSALVIDEEEAQALLRALQALGLGEVEGQWLAGRLELRARIPPTQMARWERGLATAVASHPVPFRVAVSPAAPPVATALPFTLRSIVGGVMPFVTLSDGRRLAVDGQAEGWRLLAIRPEAVVFENAQGLRFTLER